MSVLEAAYVVRSFRQRNLGLADGKLIDLIRRVRADYVPHDYQLGLEVEQLIDPTHKASPQTAALFFRGAVDAIVEHGEPLWARLAPSGRDQVIKAVSVNGTQCLRNAGLVETPPSRDAVEWWDRLAGRIRADRDEALLAQGRQGELLSLEYERTRLEKEGLNLTPAWVAVENNRLGYDILSYARTAEGHTNRLIEVKTTTASPPRFIVTRGEWLAAERYGDALEFHVWSFPQTTLQIVPVAEVRRHIPTNQGAGEWLQVEIIVPRPRPSP